MSPTVRLLLSHEGINSLAACEPNLSSRKNTVPLFPGRLTCLPAAWNARRSAGRRDSIKYESCSPALLRHAYSAYIMGDGGGRASPTTATDPIAPPSKSSPSEKRPPWTADRIESSVDLNESKITSACSLERPGSSDTMFLSVTCFETIS